MNNTERKIEHAIAYPFEHGKECIEVLDTVVKDEPQFRAAVLQLVALGGAVGVPTGAAIASEGSNLRLDAVALANIGAFFTYFDQTFVPLVEQLYKTVDAELKAKQ